MKYLYILLCTDHADSNSARTVQVDEATANTSNRTLRSSSNVHDSNTRTGVLACTCVFCNKKRKEINNKKEALISCSTENIQVHKFIVFNVLLVTFPFTEFGDCREAFWRMPRF